MKEDAEELSRSYANLVGESGSEPEAASVPANGETDTPPSPLRILEALLFVGGAPLTAARAGEIIRGLNAEQFTQALDTLNRAYRRQGRPYNIQPREDGYVLSLRPKFRGVPAKLHGGQREARLSTAAVDILALVAYRQPATKAEIDSLRGADAGPLLRQLVRRGLVQIHRAETGQPEVSYGTTPRFLEMFGLQSLEDLPRTQDLEQL
jgi:segregation and condensation protein B